MFWIIFLSFVALHGIIHLPGFLKAYSLGEFPQLTKLISKTSGNLWLAAALLFFISAVAIWLDQNYWPFMILPAIVLSQLFIRIISLE
jgi:hypothetical protein